MLIYSIGAKSNCNFSLLNFGVWYCNTFLDKCWVKLYIILICISHFFFANDLLLVLLLFSRSVVSDSFQPHGPQHTRPPRTPPSPWACSNSCPLSQWCHHLVLHYPLLLLPSIFPSIRVFSNESALHIRWPKYWSFSFSIRMNIQDWFPLGLTSLISFQSKGLSFQEAII